MAEMLGRMEYVHVTATNSQDDGHSTPIHLFAERMLEIDSPGKKGSPLQEKMFLEQFTPETDWKDIFSLTDKAREAVANAEERGEILEGWEKEEGRGR